jgi:uncharacterized SAM-binding protein YcdF (DUF218 family)
VYETARARNVAQTEIAALFFVLSKTIGVMLLPTNFLIALGLLGILLLWTRFAAGGRRLMIASIVLLATCALSPLGNFLLYPLEQRFPPWDARSVSDDTVDGIVILGGSIDPDLSVSHHVPIVRSAADRIIAAAALARRYPNARILFSGGSANLISNDAREADYAVEIFESLGIAKSRLIIERASRNTYENAVYSKALVAPQPGERWLLVTSAFHMPRAVGLFRKVGFAVEPYPVDWRAGSADDLLLLGYLSSDGLNRTDTAVREWIGLLAYRLRGRIDDLFPGPQKG